MILIDLYNKNEEEEKVKKKNEKEEDIIKEKNEFCGNSYNTKISKEEVKNLQIKKTISSDDMQHLKIMIIKINL